MQKVLGGRVVLQNLPNYMNKHFIKSKKKKKEPLASLKQEIEVHKPT